MTFAYKLRKVMKERKLKQSDVASMIGKSKSSISQYLNGKQFPTVNVMEELANVLGLEGNYFYDDKAILTQGDMKLSPIPRISVQTASRLTGLSVMSIKRGLYEGTINWGFVINPNGKDGEPVYYINALKFAKEMGVELEYCLEA